MTSWKDPRCQSSGYRLSYFHSFPKCEQSYNRILVSIIIPVVYACFMRVNHAWNRYINSDEATDTKQEYLKIGRHM